MTLIGQNEWWPILEIIRSEFQDWKGGGKQ